MLVLALQRGKSGKNANTRIHEGIALMSKVRVAGFGVSLDGFSAGIEQSLHTPIGKRGLEIFQWFFHTKTYCSMHGREGELSVTLTINLPIGQGRTLARLSSAETCLVPFAVLGRKTHGRAGGATIRHFMRQSSFLRITSVSLWSWKAERPSTL